MIEEVTVELAKCVTEESVRSDEGDGRFRAFVAIQDSPPQKTLFLHVSGEILVSNPGVDVELTFAIPQGINPNILLLRATFVQKPGIWPQVLTWKPATYRSGMVQDGQYSDVQIDAGFDSISIPVTKA